MSRRREHSLPARGSTHVHPPSRESDGLKYDCPAALARRQLESAWEAMDAGDYIVAMDYYKEGIRLLTPLARGCNNFDDLLSTARGELTVCWQLLNNRPRLFGPSVKQGCKARAPLPVEIGGPTVLDFDASCHGAPHIWRHKPWGVWHPQKMSHLFPPLRGTSTPTSSSRLFSQEG